MGKKASGMQEPSSSPSSVTQRDDIWIFRKLSKVLQRSSSTLVNDMAVSVATDPLPSPALTAVDHHHDEYYIRQQSPSVPPPRRSALSCLSALLMVTIGTLVALAFILIGVGNALTGNSGHTTAASATATVVSASGSSSLSVIHHATSSSIDPINSSL